MMLTKYLKLTFNCILIDISDTFNLIRNNSRDWIILYRTNA